jgi:hypothetical protein
MLKRFPLLSYLLLAVSCWANAQTAKPLTPEIQAKLRVEEDTLVVLAYAVLNDSVELQRFAACRELITKLVRSLKNDHSVSA